MRLFSNLLFAIKRLPKFYSIGGAVVIVAAALIGGNAFLRAPAAPTIPANATAHVSVASVATLSSAVGPLPITGTVTSENQATILAQTSGEVISLNHALGDFVNAGDIIASFDASSQRAAVEQAQGAYAAAVAALALASGTTAANTGVSSNQAIMVLQNAQTSAFAALQSAYAALDDAVHTRADALFTNPRTASASLILIVPDFRLTSTVDNERVALEQTLADAQALVHDNTAANIDQDSAAMIGHAQDVLAFLNNLIRAVNETQPSSTISAAALSADQVSLATARSEVLGAISSVTSAKNTYDTDASSATATANSASGGTENAIKAAEANVTVAQGALAAAEANLAKTVVRSPISGTIVSLPITTGDYLVMNAPVATVSNPKALYVDAEVTSNDAKTLAVGNGAIINGNASGMITFIAPALDPATGEIQVKVGISGDTSSLVDGETVTLSLDRTPTAPSIGAAGQTQITIPIVAANITPAGPVVFTVSTTSTLVAHSVTLGSILGTQVVVVSGLTPETNIVTDARGLAEGEVVVVDTPVAATSSPSL